MGIAGRGPHGERAAPAEQLVLSEANADIARARRFTVAVVLHTTRSDWARQQLAGIAGALGRFGASVVEVVDCGFNVADQVAALARLTREMPDAIISIPVGNSMVAQAHRDAARRGIKLILLDNAPAGLLPGVDYASVVSADNFGLGQVGARLLSPYIAPGGKVGIISYKPDFFATNEREIAFRKWIGSERPDIVVKSMKFAEVSLVGALLGGFLDANPDVSGLFAVWDAPAIEALTALDERSQDLPMTTVDLGNEVAISLAKRGAVKGIGAQQPVQPGQGGRPCHSCGLDRPAGAVVGGIAGSGRDNGERCRSLPDGVACRRPNQPDRGPAQCGRAHDALGQYLDYLAAADSNCVQPRMGTLPICAAQRSERSVYPAPAGSHPLPAADW